MFSVSSKSLLPVSLKLASVTPKSLSSVSLKSLFLVSQHYVETSQCWVDNLAFQVMLILSSSLTFFGFNVKSRKIMCIVYGDGNILVIKSHFKYFVNISPPC